MQLPGDLGLLSLREIVPLMGALSLTQRVNLLTLAVSGAGLEYSTV